MAQIFISYSKQDIAFARHLRTLLQTAGFDVWLDEKLVPSSQWWRMLERQIKAASVLIVIMSPSSTESRWVEREILVAENANIPIFPVLLTGEVWSRLADIQYEDLTAGLDATLPDRFIEALRAVFAGKPIANDATQPVRQPLTQGTSATERRLLESAMPAETVSGGDTELWAKISLPDSAGLREELPAVVPSGDVIQKGDARTTSFPFKFPVDPKTGERLPAQVTLKASSADFAIRSPGGDDAEIVELPPDSDSRTVIFTLIPKPGGRISGRARVLIDLFYENKVIAQISCSTLLVEQATRNVPNVAQWALWSVPVGTTSASAGGYAAPTAMPPGAAFGTQDLDQSVTPNGMLPKRGAEAAPSAPPQSPPSPAPVVPRAGNVTPFPPIQARDKESAKQRPSESVALDDAVPSSPPRRRTVNFPAAASAIAALVVVFGFAFIALNRQGASPSPSATTNLIALASTETFVALDATSNGVSTEVSPTDAATATEPDVIATESRPTLSITRTRPFPLPETIFPTNGINTLPPIQVDQPTATALPNTGGGGGRQGIAAARLIDCDTPTAEEALFIVLENDGIEFTRLEGEAIQMVVDQTVDPNGAKLLLWGSCFTDGTFTLTAELFDPPTINGLLHPRSIQFAADLSDLDNRDSGLYGFVRGLAYYMAGWFDPTTIEQLTRAASSVSDPDDSESLSASMNQQIGTLDNLYILLGNTVLLADEEYDAALDYYARVTPESLATHGNAIALANSGALLFNRIDQSVQNGADAINDPVVLDAVALAESLLQRAGETATDPADLLTIQLNQIGLGLLSIVPRDPDYADVTEVQCRRLIEDYPLDTEPLTCLAASEYTHLLLTGDRCAAPDLVSELIESLHNAPVYDTDEYGQFFWLGRLYALEAECAGDDTLFAEAIDASSRAYATYVERATTEVAGSLAIERALIDEARAYNE